MIAVGQMCRRGRVESQDRNVGAVYLSDGDLRCINMRVRRWLSAARAEMREVHGGT